MKSKFLVIFFILFLGKIWGKEAFQISFSGETFHDNNIFEQICSKKVASDFFQIAISPEYNKSLFEKNIRIKYNGNIQSYEDYSRENKYYQKIHGEIYFPLSPRACAYTKSYYSNKNWFNNNRFYSNSGTKIGYKYLLKRNRYYVEFHTGTASYNFFEEYDYRDFGLRSMIFRHINRKFSIDGQIDITFVNYLNNFIDKKRIDRNYYFDFGFEYRNRMIIGSDFSIKYQLSNYDFLTNYSFTISPYISSEIFDFYYQLIVRWNIKKYQNNVSSDRYDMSYPDPEENTNNQVFFGIERKIYKNLFFSGKIIYFSSEYKFQSDYYEKFLIGFGLKVKL